MKVKSHKDPVQPSKAPLDLVYSDVHGPFPKSYNGTKYFVSFLNDWDRSSDIILLNKKSNALAAFQPFKRRHKKGNQHMHRLCTNNGGEYSSHKFEKHWDECGIIWEPIVPENPQMNESAKQLGQTIHKMTNALLFESSLSKKYWFEMVLTANYLRNRMPVTRRHITPYESKTSFQAQLSYFCRIGQWGYAQNQKTQTG